MSNLLRTNNEQYKHQNDFKEYEKTGTVNVGIDGNMLRLQFPSKVSKAIWGTKQKYKALGLSNTPENRAKAQQIAAIAQMDILSDNLDITLEKYNPFSLEKTIEKVKPEFPGVLELCEKFFELNKKSHLAAATQAHYENFLGSLQKVANLDIINDAIEIRDAVRTARSFGQTKRILDFIYEAVQWGKRNGLILKSAENPYKDLKQDVVGKSKYQKPKRIQALIEDEYLEDSRAYSPNEALAIIEKFSHRGNPKGIYKDLVEFLFLSGCRTGELFALRWEDIADDCSEITFRHSYCRLTKKIKELKTARYGKSSRKFPCGEKLINLLQRIKSSESESPNPKAFIFHRNGNPIDHQSLYSVWVGKKDRKGLIEVLIMEGKVKTYLKPYATRHSFITWQLKAGQTPANVAKLVGNTPEMIYKYYVSADEDAKVMFEV